LIEELQVEVGGSTILNNVNMEIPQGETHILFGPNGSGKTSLMMTIMGFSGYTITHGKITFKGHDITYMPIHERARLGIGVSVQRPPTVAGPQDAQPGGSLRQATRPDGGHRKAGGR
jgi:Fe-S cluster assembly ATP-binding protein